MAPDFVSEPLQPPTHPHRTMLTAGSLVPALMAATVVALAAAEAPLTGYNYPSPVGTVNLSADGGVLTNSNGILSTNNGILSTNNGILSTNNYVPSPVVINNGITSNNPGYVSPSLLVASPPPSTQSLDYNNFNNFPGRYNNDYQDAEVHKHVYVHVAPEEPAEPVAPIVVNARKPKKHYKIVFIKTPTVLPPAAAYVNVPQPDQEKTLIYVLSKKPDLKQSLVLSTPAPTQPAKPEVFFIRYKSNEPLAQNQVLYQNGQAVNTVVNTGVNAGLKPLTNSYGVPLAAPLGPNTLQYAKSASNIAGSFNSI